MKNFIRILPFIVASAFVGCLDRTAAFVGEYEYEAEGELVFQTSQGIQRFDSGGEGEAEVREGKKSDLRVSLEQFEDCDEIEFEAVDFQNAELDRSMTCSSQVGGYVLTITVEEGDMEVDDDGEIELNLSGPVVYGGVPGTFEMTVSMERTED